MQESVLEPSLAPEQESVLVLVLESAAEPELGPGQEPVPGRASAQRPARVRVPVVEPFQGPESGLEQAQGPRPFPRLAPVTKAVRFVIVCPKLFRVDESGCAREGAVNSAGRCMKEKAWPIKI